MEGGESIEHTKKKLNQDQKSQGINYYVISNLKVILPPICA